MFKKSIPIIFIGLSIVVAVLVFGWSVFVKVDEPVSVMVVDNGNGGVVVDDVDDNNISEIDVSNWKTYQNEEYGFEFKYPLEYTLKESSVDYILLRRTEDEKNEWLVSVIVKHNRLSVNDSELTFKEFVEKLAISSCPADGPNRSIDCTGITEIKSFVNKNKINGYEIYLNETTKYFPSNKISNRTKGPIFALDIFEQTNNIARSIFFDFDDERKILNEQKKETLINQMLSTFKLTEK